MENAGGDGEEDEADLGRRNSVISLEPGFLPGYPRSYMFRFRDVRD